jgi:Tfp pilus assembly protein PilN
MTQTITAAKLITILSGSATRLKSIWRPVQRLLTFSLADEAIAPARNVSVAIDKGFVSVAYGSRFFSRVRIKGIKTYPLEDRYPTPDGLASSVSVALSNFRVAKSDITLSIPKSWVVIKLAEFPSTVKDNLPDVVSYEMDRLTPFTTGEALYDLRILKEEGGRLTLLVVAAKADLINPYIRALGERGFDVGRVTMNLSGLGTLCSFAQRTGDTLLFSVRGKEYEAGLFSDGMVTAGITGNMDDGEERLQADRVVDELELLMEEGRKQGKSPNVVLSLKDSNPLLKEMLKMRMKVPYKILEECGKTFGLPAEEIRYEAAGGVLESLWPAANGLNLLKKGRYEKAKTPLTLSLILVAAIMTIWGLSIFLPVNIEQERLGEIQREITARKDEIKKIEALKTEIETVKKEIADIDGFKSGRPMALDVLKELTRVLPKTTWLSRARISETTVNIEGYASSSTELVPKLEASKYFRKVEFASPTFRDARMNAERFNIKMEIEGAQGTEEKQPVPGGKVKK